VPGCREICIAGESGILVPVKNAVALADALEMLAVTPAMRTQFGKNARLLAEARFANEIVIAETLALYRALEVGL
jgi:glycosyltransferase involved in cell wall biosynthesis